MKPKSQTTGEFQVLMKTQIPEEIHNLNRTQGYPNGRPSVKIKRRSRKIPVDIHDSKDEDT